MCMHLTFHAMDTWNFNEPLVLLFAGKYKLGLFIGSIENTS